MRVDHGVAAQRADLEADRGRIETDHQVPGRERGRRGVMGGRRRDRDEPGDRDGEEKTLHR